MSKGLPSARRVRRLNRRQRKKLHVGEFLEQVFVVRIQFRQLMDDAAHDAFLDEFIEFIESRQLAVGGMGGYAKLAQGVVVDFSRSFTQQKNGVARIWHKLGTEWARRICVLQQ